MSDEQDKLKLSLEPPKLFGRKRKSGAAAKATEQRPSARPVSAATQGTPVLDEQADEAARGEAAERAVADSAQAAQAAQAEPTAEDDVMPGPVAEPATEAEPERAGEPAAEAAADEHPMLFAEGAAEPEEQPTAREDDPAAQPAEATEPPESGAEPQVLLDEHAETVARDEAAEHATVEEPVEAASYEPAPAQEPVEGADEAAEVVETTREEQVAVASTARFSGQPTSPAEKPSPTPVPVAAPVPEPAQTSPRPSRTAALRAAAAKAATRTAPRRPVEVEPEPLSDVDLEDAEIAAAAERPLLTAYQAAAVTGVLVGAAMVVLTWLSLRGCEAIRGTSSCGGGPGFLLLLATFVVSVLIGSSLLKGFAIPDPGSSSFLAVGLVAVVALLFLIDVLDHWSMLIAIPVISVGAYLASVWVTETFVEPGDST